MKRKYNKKDKRKYWYYIYIEECVLCGRYSEVRERRYTPKPKEYWDRHQRTEYACNEHFM
jgi:hypothetical protein